MSAAAYALGLALISAPSFAQTTTADPAPAPAPDVADAAEENIIVVTGTLLQAPQTSSPVTVVSAKSLDDRGIQTVQDALQRLPSNNGAALTNAFSANGAFAAGASGVSLRGLSTSSTLVLFDGLRAAYYPLADDATRNFVDLNTIPDDVVDHIEVQRDGASATYGADAIAGVVNIITKKEIQGVSGRAEAGISERGDHANQRLSLTAGFGDLATQGFNAYLSGFYFHEDAVYNKDRRYPYNSQDQSGICRDGVCGPEIGPNGGSINPASTGYSGFSTTTDRTLFATTFFAAPYNAANTTQLGRYQFLNPAAGCIAGETPYNLTITEFEGDPNAPRTVCQGDLINQYGVISPEIERFGGTFRATAQINDSTQAYIAANFQQSTVSYTGNPASIRANGPAGIFFPRYSTAGVSASNAVGSIPLTLPVYVCPLINNMPQATCTAANGTLNPNNPFAAQGQVARILGRIPNILEFNETRSRTYRAAFGIEGDITDKFGFSVNGVAMRTDLDRTQNGYVYIQHLLNVIADGSYNFINPLSNSQATLDYLSPDNLSKAHSDLYGVDVTVKGDLFELPGGAVRAAIGGSFRYEAVDAPSANSDVNGPTERYFVLNAFGTQGHRTVASAYGEVGIPIIESLSVNAAGRYDHYSSGQSAFSPKAGVLFTPIRQVTLRGTYSRGFRIPSFAEANAVPTTGYVNNTAGLFSDAYLAQYGCTQETFTTACPAYIRAGSYGQTTVATPTLKPEKSTSWSGGITVKPLPKVALSVDYYRIKKTGAIIAPSFGTGLQAYYSGAEIPDAYTILVDSADPAHPDATPRVAFIRANLINANTVYSEGLDFSADATFDLTPDVRFSAHAVASYIIDLSTHFPDGSVESYEGTLGNYALTAGSGTPEWHGNLQGTIEYGALSLTANVDYFDGYNLSSEDTNGAGTSGDCGLLGSEHFVSCNVKSYITVDLNTSFKINDNVTFYVNALNVFDRLPPIDPVTYGANNYNAVQGGNGIFGRQFRAGVKFGF